MTAACAHVCQSYHQAITNNKYRIPRLTNHDKTKKNGNLENLNNANLLFVKKFGGLNIRRIELGKGKAKNVSVSALFWQVSQLTFLLVPVPTPGAQLVRIWPADCQKTGHDICPLCCGGDGFRNWPSTVQPTGCP
jgi:hypothetical protein